MPNDMFQGLISDFINKRPRFGNVYSDLFGDNAAGLNFNEQAPAVDSSEALTSAMSSPYKSSASGGAGLSVGGMIGGGLNAISSLAGGLQGHSAHAKYADKLSNMKMELPDSIKEGETISRDLATQGITGYDKYKSDLYNGQAATVQQGKEVGSGTSVLKLLNDSYSKVSQAMNDLNIADSNEKIKNQLSLMHFLSNVKAPYEQRIEDFNIQRDLAVEQERMAGQKEGLQGVSDFITSVSSMFGGVI